MIEAYKDELQTALDAIGGDAVVVLEGVKEIAKQSGALRVVLDDTSTSGTFEPGAKHVSAPPVNGVQSKTIYNAGIQVAAHLFGPTHDAVWCLMANVIAAFQEILGPASFTPAGFTWFDEKDYMKNSKGLTLVFGYFLPITDTPVPVTVIDGFDNSGVMELKSGDVDAC